MIQQVLNEYLTLEGVTTAALISRDGFCIALATHDGVDPDALGALAAQVMTLFARGSAALDGGRLQRLLLEFRGGAAIITPVTDEEFLVILTRTTESVGRLNYLIAVSAPRVAAAM